MEPLTNIIGHNFYKRQTGPPSLAPPGVVPNFINPVSRGKEIVIVPMVTGCLALVVVAIRIWTKISVTHMFGKDDVFILSACVFMIGRIVNCVIMADVYHEGRHVWDTSIADDDQIMRTMWIDDILYMLGIMFIKLSILCWYTQIFKSYRKFVYVCYVVMGFCCAYSIAFVFVYSFFCHPEDKEWKLETTPGECWSVIIINEVVGGLNLATDIILLCLPLPLIAKQKLELKKKLGVLAIMATGVFVCITTIVREVMFFTKLRQADQSWVAVDDIIWLTLEFHVGLICSCLPTMVPAYRYFRSKRNNFTPRYISSYFFSNAHRRRFRPSTTVETNESEVVLETSGKPEPMQQVFSSPG